LKIAKCKKYWKISDVRIPDSRHFRGLGIYIEKTYIGGIGQEMKPLLDAKELAGNWNGLRSQYVGRIASGRSFGQFLLLGASCVHEVSVIPFLAILLKRSKTLVTLGQQRDAALKFWRIKEAGPGGGFAEMECQGRARPGCSFSRCSHSRLCPRLDNLLDLKSAGLIRSRGFVRDRGLGRGSGLGWGRSLGRGLFRRSRCSLSSRGRGRISPDLRHFWGFAFIYVGALVAYAGIFSSPGALVGAPALEVSCWAPVSMWTSEVEGSC
jgi:hypothetical protein